jgi:outer membrane protein assembly factor BamE (lipoprotein component of BamABCDE complex)
MTNRLMAVYKFVLVAALAGCAQMERAEVAKKAQTSMVGMTKEQVLSCMGPPVTRMQEGATEVWQYSSGNGTQIIDDTGNGAIASRLFCTVNVTMTDGQVRNLRYSGPTGGPLTPGEQCGFAVHNCTGAL